MFVLKSVCTKLKFASYYLGSFILWQNLSKKVTGTTWIVVTSDPQYDKMYPGSTSQITFLDIKSNHDRTTSHTAAKQAITEMKAILKDSGM